MLSSWKLFAFSSKDEQQYCKKVFTMTAKFLHAHWLIFIVNKQTDTQIYNLCEDGVILLASD